MKAFQFAPGLDLRVIEKDGEPWFVAKDVCEVLGMDTAKTGTGPFVAGLDADERASIGNGNGYGLHGQTVLVSESGLYSLVLKSRKPEAKAFRKWVTSEVLPSIRKNGGYMAPAVAKLAVESPAEFMARALVMANETIQGLQKAVKGLETETPEAYGLTSCRACMGASARNLEPHRKKPVIGFPDGNRRQENRRRNVHCPETQKSYAQPP